MGSITVIVPRSGTFGFDHSVRNLTSLNDLKLDLETNLFLSHELSDSPEWHWTELTVGKPK